MPVTGTVAPHKRTVHLVLEQRIRGRFRRVGVKPVRARRGHFKTSFVPGFVARYRYVVIVKPTTTQTAPCPSRASCASADQI